MQRAADRHPQTCANCSNRDIKRTTRLAYGSEQDVVRPASSRTVLATGGVVEAQWQQFVAVAALVLVE